MSKANYTKEELLTMKPNEYRRIAREGGWLDTDFTNYVCRGYVQANLAIVPKEFAFDFFLFCYFNPRPFPVIDITEAGNPHPERVAPEADLRTDLVKYRVFRDGELIDEPNDILKYWRNDLVAFLIGCGTYLDWALQAENIRSRVIGDYTSNIQLVPAGPFHGPMIVSGRIIKAGYGVTRAVQISSRHPALHGAPIHYGNPEAIGIKDVMDPDYSRVENWPIDPPQHDEMVVFWGCGASVASVAMASKIPLMISHFSGPMFITDRTPQELAVL